MSAPRVQVTTLGQPLEVVKTQMASARGDTMAQALKKVWSRGGVLGCASPFLLPIARTFSPDWADLRLLPDSAPPVYQGLIPWAWIEASTKGAVLLFAAAEIEGAAMTAGIGPATAGLLGGMGGGIAQAYATVGASPGRQTLARVPRAAETDSAGRWQVSARA